MEDRLVKSEICSDSVSQLSGKSGDRESNQAIPELLWTPNLQKTRFKITSDDYAQKLSLSFHRTDRQVSTEDIGK
ncbi:hypothetical protein DPMN_071462 [Dreissena polymorpha]|uniref:Uncharacterized protein n=1 Tax=Dreissena polymorpha TaxID=45954 RepID=A0A9D3Z2C4_DREPO|nr:hypothetical protein DPMN_071462 [Dreissena polymorpha]